MSDKEKADLFSDYLFEILGFTPLNNIQDPKVNQFHSNTTEVQGLRQGQDSKRS